MQQPLCGLLLLQFDDVVTLVFEPTSSTCRLRYLPSYFVHEITFDQRVDLSSERFGEGAHVMPELWLVGVSHAIMSWFMSYVTFT